MTALPDRLRALSADWRSRSLGNSAYRVCAENLDAALAAAAPTVQGVVPEGWNFQPHDKGIIVTAPDGGGVLVDPENGSIAGIVLWELASALLATPTASPPPKGDDIESLAEFARDMRNATRLTTKDTP